MLAPNGNVVFENNIDTVLGNVNTTDFELNIFGSNNTTQAAGEIITSDIITLDSLGDFTLSNDNELNNITVLNSNNVTINNVNQSNIVNVNAVANVNLSSNDALLGSVTASSITIDAGNNTITDANDSIGPANNLTANNVFLMARNGIGSVTNEIETEITGTTSSPGELSAVNNNGGDIAVSNVGNLLLRNVSNLDNDGNISISNDGNLSIDTVETLTRFSEPGLGRIDLNVVNGNITAADKGQSVIPIESDVRARSVKFELDGFHGVGSSDRPLSVEVPDTVDVLFSSQTFIYSFGTIPLDFRGDNEFSNQIFDLISNLAGQQLIEVESLAQIDPAIFTDVRNYSHSDNALMMPVDQRYDDSEEEKLKTNQIN